MPVTPVNSMSMETLIKLCTVSPLPGTVPGRELALNKQERTNQVKG
jgi:hypothetical protein